ncbi:DNA phosphorothioation-dependent restriction protein DptG [Anaerosphaera aminiphila DSM 21120]|uniref:DNA phosphorothioation-dependent restriction protein DptG n=1 Tax=Anaerosphaera aminiphila DSM 21120 TaxID=1120995 RepID=A0A1M5PM42_9FIRM|nr:hypothetical protein [Anaerosphaera aminiphila]SHH02619.1 DNA phosphorothioation-dependent restriction protein DptG [Anaerosphaera aminiphila DSM 21120]
MDTNKILIELGIELAKIISKQTITTISDKVKKVKASGDKDGIILELESIIDELISDKRSLIEIAQKYEELTSFQKITDEDVQYITQSLMPVIEELLEKAMNFNQSSTSTEELQQLMGIIKPIISVETFNVLQMLGFNFRDAIGQPLTDLIKSLILSKSKSELDIELAISNNRVSAEYYNLLQNEEAVKMLKEFNEMK